MKKTKIPSAHDVAKLAGVSQAAVSRAFTSGASISQKTRDKVMEAADKLGYRPNHLARSLITGKSGIIGVVIGNPRNTFHLEALAELSERIASAGYYLQVFVARSPEGSNDLVDSLLRFRVDALVMMSADISERLARQCEEMGVPVIFFNRRSRIRGNFFSVSAGNYDGARQIAEHFIKRGYRRPAIITASEMSLTSLEREAGFVETIVAHGLPFPMKAIGSQGTGAAPAARRLLSNDSMPDSIFCTSDYMAMAAIEVARFEFGLDIGKQLGIAGFDDTDGASWRSFDLTSYTQPIVPMIEYVARIILDPASFSNNREVVVEGELKPRASTSVN